MIYIVNRPGEVTGYHRTFFTIFLKYIQSSPNLAHFQTLTSNCQKYIFHSIYRPPPGLMCQLFPVLFQVFSKKNVQSSPNLHQLQMLTAFEHKYTFHAINRPLPVVIVSFLLTFQDFFQKNIQSSQKIANIHKGT